MKLLKFCILNIMILSCNSDNNKITEVGFQNLMDTIAEGWSTQNTDMTLSVFDLDAIYMEPPNIQYYRGHKELRPYFDALTSEYNMEFHNLWFNEASQSGVGEFTFSYGKDTSDVGVAVIELKNGKIKFWREYLQKGPTDFQNFLSTTNKKWKWHIGNYPAPKDSISIE